MTGFGYDGNNNVLSDGFNSYGYDLFERLNIVGTTGSTTCATATCLTYDALGRVVETQSPTKTKQFIYSPVGKTVIMTGGSVDSAYFPLPGGSQLVQTASGTTGLAYEHRDWLGSNRIRSTIPSSGNGTVTYNRAFAPTTATQMPALPATNKIHLLVSTTPTPGNWRRLRVDGYSPTPHSLVGMVSPTPQTPTLAWTVPGWRNTRSPKLRSLWPTWQMLLAAAQRTEWPPLVPAFPVN
jgi:hypothetical protein